MTTSTESSVLESAISQAEQQSSTVSAKHDQPIQISGETWKIGTDLCKAYCEAALTQPPKDALSLLLSRLLISFASCAASRCLQTGDVEYFTLGSVALSLALSGVGDWRDLAGTAAVLRAAVDERHMDRAALLSALPPIQIDVRKLLESTKPLSAFGIRTDGTGGGSQFLTIVEGKHSVRSLDRET